MNNTMQLIILQLLRRSQVAFAGGSSRQDRELVESQSYAVIVRTNRSWDSRDSQRMLDKEPENHIMKGIFGASCLLSTLGPTCWHPYSSMMQSGRDRGFRSIGVSSQ